MGTPGPLASKVDLSGEEKEDRWSAMDQSKDSARRYPLRAIESLGSEKIDGRLTHCGPPLCQLNGGQDASNPSEILNIH